MRAVLVGAVLIAAIGSAFAASGPAGADGRPAFPSYDLEVYCHEQARYSFAATLGDSTFDGVLSKCEATERDAMESARVSWATATPEATAECLGLADGRYTYLMRCLDSIRTVRSAR